MDYWIEKSCKLVWYWLWLISKTITQTVPFLFFPSYTSNSKKLPGERLCSSPQSLTNYQEHFFFFFPQVSITDYVVFDQCSLFQTIIQATHTVATAAQAPVEKVADKLRMAFWSQQLQCQPSLLGVNGSGVWISSGKNEFHVAKGNLVGWCAFAF